MNGIIFKVEPPQVRVGRWIQPDLRGYTTPGGTPYYACGHCGGSGHLYGVEYTRRKVICDGCGRVNIYPWETAIEQVSSLWEEDDAGETDEDQAPMP